MEFFYTCGLNNFKLYKNHCLFQNVFRNIPQNEQSDSLFMTKINCLTYSLYCILRATLAKLRKRRFEIIDSIVLMILPSCILRLFCCYTLVSIHCFFDMAKGLINMKKGLILITLLVQTQYSIFGTITIVVLGVRYKVTK